MKKLLLLALALIATVPAARAWNYQDGDVLLIFRSSGFNDVELDLGSINQFINKADGYTANVTGWNLNLVTNTFGRDLSGVSVIVSATTSNTASPRTVWLSSSEPATTVYNVTPSFWLGTLYSTINSVGARPVTYLVPTSGASSYSIDPSGTYAVASYDQIVSDGGIHLSGLPQFGSKVLFTVEQTIPGTFYLWAIQPSSVIPKPAATPIGSFTITASGALSFRAGNPFAVATPPSIVSASRVGNVASFSFTTTSSGTYQLVFSSTLANSVSSWATVGATVAGDGNNHTLSHTNAAGIGFYSVLRTP